MFKLRSRFYVMLTVEGYSWFLNECVRCGLLFYEVLL